MSITMQKASATFLPSLGLRRQGLLYTELPTKLNSLCSDRRKMENNQKEIDQLVGLVF